MTYQETLDYLYAQLPMFSRVGAAAYKVDLHNSIELCQAIGNPQHHFKSIHIAGTNGKGSTSHMLAAILQQAGYKTGLYTSPHIKEFGERIRVNGEMIKQEFVVDFVERTKEISDRVEPSFFELTVAMAFQYFSEEKVDIAIIETGLGGRLDSTNIIQPLLSVITNIGYDHTNILGNTLTDIAWQKAGIIKKNTPVVIGEILPITNQVFIQEANEKEAPLLLASSRFVIESSRQSGNHLICDVKDLRTKTVDRFELDLAGSYQQKNICTVLSSVEVLRAFGFLVTKGDLQAALKNVKGLTGMRGRWDIIQDQPKVILDVAHNEDGIRQVTRQLKENYPNAAVHFILGFVKDKDVSHVLELFPTDAHYYFTNAHIPRAIQHTELQALAASKGINGKSFDDVNVALAAAKKQAGAKDVIMVCGSFFIIGEID